MKKVTVADILKLDIMKGHRISAGVSGLSNEVHYVNVYDTKVTEIDSSIQVFPGDIYLTTLYFGRNDEKFVIDFINMLIKIKASALIIMDENIQKIPLESCKSCDSNGLPVVFMDSRTPYSLVISSIMEFKLAFEQRKSIEDKLNDLLNSRISTEDKDDITMDLNPNFQKNVICLFALEKDPLTNAITPSTENPNLLNAVNRNAYCFAAEYKGGVILILSFTDARMGSIDSKKEIEDAISLVHRYIPRALIGISTPKVLSELGEAISESYIALISGYSDVNGLSYYKQIGISRILLEHKNSKVIEDFYQDVTGPILKNDRLNNTSLFDTMLTFVDNDMDFKETSKSLFVHENTIRYRINKIKEMIPYGRSEIDFYETISLASKVYRIKTF